MHKSILFGLIFLALIAVLLGGYYWYTLQMPTTSSAEEYIDSGFDSIATGESAGSTEASAPTPTPDTVSNPPLTNGTTLSELEADLDSTIIEEESFSDL